MPITDVLRAHADATADRLKAKQSRLQIQLLELESRKADLEAQMRSADKAPERVLSFTPQIDGEYQCPRCWVEHELRSRLKPIPGDTAPGVFRCQACRLEFNNRY